MKAPESAKTTKYFLTHETAAIAFVVRENWIGVYGNEYGAINMYNLDGTLFAGTMPASELPTVVANVESVLSQTFETSEIILRGGDIEDLSSYTIVEG